MENEEYDSDIRKQGQVLGSGVTQQSGKDCCMEPPPSPRTQASPLQARSGPELPCISRSHVSAFPVFFQPPDSSTTGPILQTAQGRHSEIRPPDLSYMGVTQNPIFGSLA